jgi:uncharacterized phage protein (predicted DNA packaging)
MAALLTLAETKLHCRIDHDDEDALLGALIATATTAVGDYMNMDAEDVDDSAPPPVKSAALLLVGTLYEQRESQSDRPYNRNPAFEMLLAPYKVYA